jgi:opacity protein-like surface antigen
MKTLLAAAAGIALLAGASAASAENYASIGYSKIDLEGIKLGAVNARLGTNINPWFGVEGELAIGVDDDSETVPAGDPDFPAGTYAVDLKHQIAAFAVARAPLGEGFTVFGRVGYASSKAEFTSPTASVQAKGDGVAYGIGAQYQFGANAIRGDVTRYDVEIGDADAYQISFVRMF